MVVEQRAAKSKMSHYEGLPQQYELLGKMGDGAFSNVYKAYDRLNGRKVAIKCVRKYELNHNQVSLPSRTPLSFWLSLYHIFTETSLVFGIACRLDVRLEDAAREPIL